MLASVVIKTSVAKMFTFSMSECESGKDMAAKMMRTTAMMGSVMTTHLGVLHDVIADGAINLKQLTNMCGT